MCLAMVITSAYKETIACDEIGLHWLAREVGEKSAKLP